MDPKLREKISIEAQRIEEDSLYSAKGHYEAAKQWSRAHLWIGLPAAVLAAVASGSALASQELLAGISAAIVAAMVATATFLNPNEKAVAHQAAGAKYHALRNQARIFYSIELQGNVNLTDIQPRLIELARQRDELNLASPFIPRWAFVRARKGIEVGEARYEVDQLR